MEPQTTQSQPVVAPAATPVTTSAPLQAPITSSPFGRVALYSVLFLAVGFVGGFYTPGLLNPVAEVPVAVQQTDDKNTLTQNYYGDAFEFKYPKKYSSIFAHNDKVSFTAKIGMSEDGSVPTLLTIDLSNIQLKSLAYKTEKQKNEACAKQDDDSGCGLSQEGLLMSKKIIEEATTTPVTLPYWDLSGEVISAEGGKVFIALKRSPQAGTVYAYAIIFKSNGDAIMLETMLSDGDEASAQKNPEWKLFKEIAKTLEVKN